MALSVSISIDLGPLFLVLQTILFDVHPELGNNLRAGKRLGADDCRKVCRPG